MKNPSFDPRRDKRFEVDAPEWAYCCRRFRQYWDERRVKGKAVPQWRNAENVAGWFFPTIWVADFARDPDPIDARVVMRDRGTLPRADFRGKFPKRKEFKSWNLPVGTMLEAATATVVYPDGSSESWGAIRRRLAGERKAEAA